MSTAAILLLFPAVAYVLHVVVKALVTAPGSSVVPFCDGFLVACAVLLVPKVIAKRWLASSGAGPQQRDSRIYGLEHGLLNLHTPPLTWWMNMGYWESQPQPNDLPSACKALLTKVLQEAGILQNPPVVADGSHRSAKIKVRIVDAGFGCGDQTIAISHLKNVETYIGITIDAQQFRFANQRLHTLGLLSQTNESFAIFQADAAAPISWTPGLKQALQERFSTKKHSGTAGGVENWLLALDTLYHFQPSRHPLMQYAYRDLHASVAAFDLLLTDQPLSLVQYFMLRLVCAFSASPFTNFLSTRQYRQQLHEAGYCDDDIEVIDISRHVFNPLAQFLNRQDDELRTMGLSIGRFRAAQWLFAWWGRTGVVRGCIVIARYRS